MWRTKNSGNYSHLGYDRFRKKPNITSWRLIRVNKFIKNGVTNEIERKG